MIDFRLTSQQEELTRVARRFSEKEIKPIAMEYDRRIKPAECIPWEAYRKGAELGFPCMAAPKEYGGMDAGDIDICLVAEELAEGISGWRAAF